MQLQALVTCRGTLFFFPLPDEADVWQSILSDIYFEVDNEDALLESVMGEDKIAVTPLFPPSSHFLPLFHSPYEFVSV